jgi:mRNA interferase MazF
MPIQYPPHLGEILICDYDSGFKPPEMVKRRPVVVVSPRRHSGSGLCTVVPLSTSAPHPVEPFHHRIVLANPLPHPKFNAAEMWAKADIVSTVAYWRLEMFRGGRGANGKRLYPRIILSPEDLAAIQNCVLSGLGLGPLTI